MKKYNFRLENVLRVRRVQEDIAKSELIKANTEVQNAIEAVEQRVADYQAQIDQRSMGTSGVEGFMKQRYFNELSSKAVIAARASHAAAASQASLMRSAHTEAARKVKALDRLDEKSREEYAIEAQRESDREMDEIVTARFTRPLRTAI